MLRKNLYTTYIFSLLKVTIECYWMISRGKIILQENPYKNNFIYEKN